MSLRLKYLVPLNAVILVLWGGYAFWSLSVFEEEFMRAEVGAIEHLAIGLKFHIEHSIRKDENIRQEQLFLEELAARNESLDIMVIDTGYTVIAATDQTRIGARWYEDSIEEVAAGDTEISWNTENHTHKGRRAIDVSVAVLDSGGRTRFVIHIARWLDDLLTVLCRQRVSHIASAALLLLSVALVANLLTYRLVIRPLEATHRRIESSGWLEEHPLPPRGDEVGRLHDMVASLLEQIRQRTEDLENTIAEKQKLLEEVSRLRDDLADKVDLVSGELADTRQRLARAERVAALGQLSAALAHQIRNPLHIVHGAAETAARQYPEVSELTQDIGEEVNRIEEMIEELLNYTRPLDLNRERVDLEEMLGSIVRRLSRDTSAGELSHGCSYSIRVAQGLDKIEADPTLLDQAVVNLVTNALDVSPAGSTVELSARPDRAGGVIIAVEDRGPGIADEDLPRVFDPFFTRKSHGTGLGLPVVERIADLHGGEVAFARREGGGTIATLHIPARERGGET